MRTLLLNYLAAVANEEALIKTMTDNFGPLGKMDDDRRAFLDDIGTLIELATVRVMRAIVTILDSFEPNAPVSLFDMDGVVIEVNAASRSVRRVAPAVVV